MTTATLPVYLIHWNRPEWCALAIESIRKSKDVDVGVTVIDNGGTRFEMPGVRTLRQSVNLGFTGGANVALADWFSGDAAFAVVGAHDLIVETGTLARLLSLAAAHPRAGVLGPDYGDRQNGGGRLLGHASGVIWQEWVSGACLLLRRECVADVGAFDEDYGSYMEDVDYCYRARRAGWLVGTALGAEADGLGSTGGATIRAAANYPIFEWKHHGPRGFRRGLVLLIKQAAWRFLHGNFRSGWVKLAAVPHAVVTRRRLRRTHRHERAQARGPGSL